jgi:hypothetical protein
MGAGAGEAGASSVTGDSSVLGSSATTFLSSSAINQITPLKKENKLFYSFALIII